MRFHLPAYIIGELNGFVDADILFHLTQLDDYGLSRFTSLDAKQNAAILEFLEWCLDQDEYQFEQPAIKRTIDEYWSKAQHSNDT